MKGQLGSSATVSACRRVYARADEAVWQRLKLHSGCVVDIVVVDDGAKIGAGTARGHISEQESCLCIFCRFVTGCPYSFGGT